MVRLPFKKYKLLFAFLIFTYLLASILYIVQAFLFKNIFDAVSQEGYDVFPVLLIKTVFFTKLLTHKEGMSAFLLCAITTYGGGYLGTFAV